MSKTVSVVIPCYNQGQYLWETVNSVLSSSYKNIEVIIVNDGSTDDTTLLTLKEIQNTPKIKVYNIENSGVCYARNFAIDKAIGEYILPLDSDDKIGNTYIEKAVKILEENSNIGIVYCDAEFFDKKTGKWELEPASIENMLIKNRIFNAAMFRKSEFLKAGGYKSEFEIGCEDWDFWISLMEIGAQVFKIPEILFYYRIHENTRTGRAIRLITSLKIQLNLIKNHKDLYDRFGYSMYFKIIYLKIVDICNEIKRRIIKKGNVNV